MLICDCTILVLEPGGRPVSPHPAPPPVPRTPTCPPAASFGGSSQVLLHPNPFFLLSLLTPLSLCPSPLTFFFTSSPSFFCSDVTSPVGPTQTTPFKTAIPLPLSSDSPHPPLLFLCQNVSSMKIRVFCLVFVCLLEYLEHLGKSWKFCKYLLNKWTMSTFLVLLKQQNVSELEYPVNQHFLCYSTVPHMHRLNIGDF